MERQKQQPAVTKSKPVAENGLAATTPPDLTPIVLNQLQTQTKLKEEHRKLRRGSRSSQNSTPGTVGDKRSGSSCSNGGHVGGIPILDSGSESCGEDAHMRTAEAFMSGIKSAISASLQDGGASQDATVGIVNNIISDQSSEHGGLSAELVGEVNSVLSKLMSSLNTCDPNLIPLITNLQTSLKATVNSKSDGDYGNNNAKAVKKDEALSEFSHNENPFFDNLDEKVYTTSKIPWKIRAARKRATKHHTTGMTKEEFARIKKSLDESAINFSTGPSQSYALARNKSEGALQYQMSAHQLNNEQNNQLPSTYQNVEGSRPYPNGAMEVAPALSSNINPNDLGYASDVCDYSIAPAKQSNNKKVVSNVNQGAKSSVISTPVQQDSSYVNQIRPVSMTTSGDTEVVEPQPHTPSLQRKTSKASNYGVRAKIARRKMMRQANAADALNPGVSDQEGSEVYDDDDSVEEKQDSESMNDSQSSKPKFTLYASNSLGGDESSSSMYSSSEWTPETARKNWNSRFSNIKHSFNAASEEDLAFKSRSPSMHRQVSEPDERGRTHYKSVSPSKRVTDYHDRMTPGSERAQSKEDKNKLNAAMTASSKGYASETGTIAPLSLGPKRSIPDLYAQSKSKQPTPIREPMSVSSGRLSKSVPREGYDDHRAEVLGFVKAGGNSGAGNKSGDMDYQEYMNIINKVRKSKEIERVRTEQLRLASMYAREKKRQEELKKEDERLQRERVKIEAEKNAPPPKITAPVTGQISLPVTTVNVPISRSNQESNDSNINVITNQVPRLQGIEKGQLDNVEVEQKKISPTRKLPLAQPSGILNIVPVPVNFVNVSHQTVSNHTQSIPSSTIKIPDPHPPALAPPFKIPVQPPEDITKSVNIKPNISDKRAEREEQLRMEQMWLEQRQQQVKVEQENLERLREEQLRQEKEREEIRRLEIERLRQIQEEQKRLEEERRRQEEQMRMEQMRLEEERKRQEKLQAEKNAEYNRQRLDIEAKNIAALQEEQRAARERLRQQQLQQQISLTNTGERAMNSQEKIIQERLLQQEKLREEHRREEAKIRQEKLNLINQEEMLIKRQEEMLHQIEAERENLAKQELLIRTRQQDRLKQVRQEKQLLEKQEETLLLREQQLLQEKIRQEKLREEQRVLREQEEAIRKRQEEISKELMGELSGDITMCPALEGQVFPGPSKPMFMQPIDLQKSLSPTKDLALDNHLIDSKASTSPPPLQYIPPTIQNLSLVDQGEDPDQIEEDGEGSYYSGSESDEDTLDEDGYYESKVEVKQNATSVPTSVRTIETKIDNPPWAPVTPYLCYPEKHPVNHAQEEISAIFSQCKHSQYTKAGVVTSPESMRTSTNMITTPESSISLHSQVSHTETRSRQSSYSPPPLPPLPSDEVQTDLFLPVQPDIPPRGDSYAVYSSASDMAPIISISETSNKRDLLDAPSNTSSGSQLSPRLGGPGSAFKPYASSENLFDPNTTKHVQDLPPMVPTHNYPLKNGDIGDSRFLIKTQNGSREDFRGPVHGKIRELRKQPVKAPFSTTDTEPEMRECNLSSLDSRKKGSKKQIVYSTSETEEEYQAYLRSKPKWHGKGGHKDSWDPLLIQSPPQITQKPVGVIPKPQAALAVVPVVERGSHSGNTPFLIQSKSDQALHSSESYQQKNNGNFNPINNNSDQMENRPVKQLDSMSVQATKNETTIAPTKSFGGPQPVIFDTTHIPENRPLKQPETVIFQQPISNSIQPTLLKPAANIKPKEQFENVVVLQPVIKSEAKLVQQFEPTPLTQTEFNLIKPVQDIKSPENAAKLQPGPIVPMPFTERVQKSNSIVEVRKLEQTLPQSVAEINRKSMAENQDLNIMSLSTTNFVQPEKGETDGGPKSLSSIMKQTLQEQPQLKSIQSNLSHNVKPPPFMGQNGDVLKYQASPMMQRVNRTPTSQLVSEMDTLSKKERSPNVSHLHERQSQENLSAKRNISDNIQSNSMQINSKTFQDKSQVELEKSPSLQGTNNLQVRENSQESKLTPQRELQQKLMNEALQRIGYRKELTKKHFSNVTRTNPTIAAMEIMTRKEIKQGEMEQRLARGEVVQIPIPATPPYMKQPTGSGTNNNNEPRSEYKNDFFRALNQQKVNQQSSEKKMQNLQDYPMPKTEQISQMQKARSMEPQNVANASSVERSKQAYEKNLAQGKMTPNAHDYPRLAKRLSTEPEQQPQVPIIILKKEPKRLDPSEIKARTSEAEKESRQFRQMSQEKVVQQVKKATQPTVTNVPVENKPLNPKEQPKQVVSQKATSQEQAKQVKKLTNADKVAEALRAAKAQTSPKIPVQPAPIKDTFSSQVKQIKDAKPLQGEKQVEPQRVDSTSKRAPSQTPTKPFAEVKPMNKDQEIIERKRDSDDISESEFVRRETVKRAAEKFEKVAALQQFGGEETSQRAPPPSLSSLGPRGRSKSIGHSLAQKLQEADEEIVKSILPWASSMTTDDQMGRPSPAPVKRRIAMRNKGYDLRMSKSSDSITAAKLLAEARMQNNDGSGHSLRINQDMSKSIEKQIDVYTKTREEIRKILQVAKTCSVNDRIKLFDSQYTYDIGEDYDEREQKAEAIRREILELKAQRKEDESGTSIEMQSPVEAKVKPLKIPMKPKMSDPGPAKQALGVPGTTLRINQPAGSAVQQLAPAPEVKSILRSSRSTERRPEATNLNAVPGRRGSLENIGSIKSIIESFAEEESQKPANTTNQAQPASHHLKSILVNSEKKGKKKSPKLVHSVAKMQIYTQSATDYSEDDDEIAQKNRPLEPHLLQIPELPESVRMFTSGVRKSKSFATTGGQYECNLDEREASEKKKTMMAFFAADIAAQQASLRSNPNSTQQQQQQQQQQPAIRPSAASAARYAAATAQKRGSITSISDEILGDDDLRDVDAVFESLLNSTFDEKAASRHMSRREGMSMGRQARSKSSHALLQEVSMESKQESKSERRKSGGTRTSSVTRKPSKNKIVAGEVKAVHIQHQQAEGSLQRSHSHGNSMLSAHIEQRKAGEEAIFRKISDPVQSISTSKHHVNNRVSGGSPPPSNPIQPPTHTPSPTLSEYDTCDPWDEY